jgi:hypothetical protein
MMLLTGEDMDNLGSRGTGTGTDRDRDKESFPRHIHTSSAAGSESYHDLSYPSTSTPWDSGHTDPHSSMKALHHPLHTPLTEVTQYMSL